KGALNTITLSLARALAPLIRVNTVCPGYIDTPWFTKGRGVEGAAKVRDSRRCRSTSGSRIVAVVDSNIRIPSQRTLLRMLESKGPLANICF
ncbi:SDR family oxidoreductase, partial [Bradyrhizobium sp.]|uniref:SDR family oxidoreductase n=1 Tax=Bradyrhizobium sp. TaxID=376 RepID=UPI003C49641F